MEEMDIKILLANMAELNGNLAAIQGAIVDLQRTVILSSMGFPPTSMVEEYVSAVDLFHKKMTKEPF